MARSAKKSNKKRKIKKAQEVWERYRRSNRIIKIYMEMNYTNDSISLFLSPFYILHS